MSSANWRSAPSRRAVASTTLRSNSTVSSKSDDRGQRLIKLAIVRGARRRAKLNGLAFSIGVDDFDVPELCPALGIPLRCNPVTASPCSPTLDRVINSLGYVRGNVVVVSMRANRIKSDATIAELRLLSKFYTRLERKMK